MERDEPKAFLSRPLIEASEENGLSTINTERGRAVRDGKSKIVEEVKKQLWLAGPMVSVNLFQYCLQVISIMFVGHLDELSLSGTSIATSFATVTGFSLLMGIASALDTLAGQSYGAKQYHMLGIHTQRGMVVLLAVSVPVAVVWANTELILVAVGQDPAISAEAGRYTMFMIPSLFAYSLLQCMVKFLLSQSIVIPMVVCSGVTALLHVLLCWALVLKAGLGSRGAALAIAVSYWVNVVLFALYVKLSPSCSRTWTGFSTQAFTGVFAFIRLAVPSTIMVCLVIWSFEMMVILSGFLPNPELETSVLSITLNTAVTVWMIPFGLSCAVSTRVSNELGAGNPEAARLAVWVVMVMVSAESALVGLALFLIRNIWGFAFSNEAEVVKYVAEMMPILAVLNFLDGLQCVLSGIARGCGWQKIGAYVNLGAYYLVGIPLSLVLAFVLHIGGKGLWLGLICALVVQVLSLLIITIRTNWNQEAKKATDRVYDSIVPINPVS